jgi:hypothetical protein
MKAPQKQSEVVQIEELLDKKLDFDWFDNTKEKLSSADVLTGLLDHGLFGEKIPPCFTTAGLTTIVSESMSDLLEEKSEKKLRKNINECSHDYVRYEALRDINIPRHLGIPHPHAYAIQALAISKHWQEIATHCNLPIPTFSRVHVRHVGNGSIFEMNYKGVERFQHEENEIQWMSGAKYVVEADIAACFPSIYTHSIPWALYGKNESKNETNLTKSVGNLLDKCSQSTRDKQTNGLLIGPHASNIISEIILTRIDTALQDSGYNKVVRHVDDYKCYVETLDKAEQFIKTLGMKLRAFEMSLNEKKTRILELPKPSVENWHLVLNRFLFPKDEEIRFSDIRSFLDLALECAQASNKSTPLNYAIKMLAGYESPRKLNSRAKRLYVQEAMNLALSYPYLVPLLDEFVFDKYWHDGLKLRIADFITSLIQLGIRKLYTDAIAHAIYYALKHELSFDLKDETLIEIVSLDDCVTNVLLLEYAKKRDRKKVKSAIIERANDLINEDSREKDRHWLLIYQVWTHQELMERGQIFLAKLKSVDFQFFSKTLKSVNSLVECVAPVPQQLDSTK